MPRSQLQPFVLFLFSLFNVFVQSEMFLLFIIPYLEVDARSNEDRYNRIILPGGVTKLIPTAV